MTDKIESKGKTVKDAVNEALLQMGARKDEVQIEVLEEPKSGLFGILGGKPARVLVTRKKSRGGRRRNPRNHNDDAVAHNLSDGRSSRGGNQGGGRQRRNDENQDGARGDSRRSRGGRNRRNDNRQSERAQDGNRQGNNRQESNRQENSRQDNNRQEGRRQGGNRQGGKRQDERRSGGRQQKPAAQVSNDMPNQDQNDNRSQGQNARGGRNQNEGRSQGGSRRPRSRSRRSQNDPRNMSRRDIEASGNNLENQNAATDPAQPMENNIPQEEVLGRGRSNRSERPERPERSERSDRPNRQERQGRGRRQDNDRPSNKQGGRGRRQPNAPDQQEAQARPAARTEQPMVPDEIIHTGISAVKYSTPVRDIAEDAVDQMLEDFTNGMLNRAGFPVRCEVKPGDYRQVRVITDDSSAGMLIGRHGAAIDSIEHLVERMAGMAAGDRVRMNLDINNYRRRRQDTLQDRVLDAVDVVMEKDRTFHMEPMNPRERRLVHLQVEKLDGVRTFTMGGGPAKHVVIAPDNGDDDGDKRNRDAKPEAEAQPENKEAPAAEESEFDEFDDGPQPETNELVVDDDDHRRLI